MISWIISPAMVRTSARPSLWKTICSSRRFRNSGLKYCRTSPRTTSSTRYFVYSAPSSAVLPGSELGPGGSRVQRRGPGSGSSEASTAGIASRAASTARTRADRLPDRTPWMSRAPMFEVSTMRAFLKLTTRPCESVRRPSSKICSRRLNTSGCAFSTSSSSSKQHGRRRTASVSLPPSPWPTYPARATHAQAEMPVFDADTR
mmetsp:Transcript_39881/g.118769  ORF Transcript_39881/g.118769 Transcript_39881/m.118769 type:complete len:203 (-) Transcript_39881:2567-3175(-)